MKLIKLGILVLCVGIFSFSCNGNRPNRNGLVNEGQYNDPHNKIPEMDTGAATKPGSDQKKEDSAAYKPIGEK